MQRINCELQKTLPFVYTLQSSERDSMLCSGFTFFRNYIASASEAKSASDLSEEEKLLLEQFKREYERYMTLVNKYNEILKRCKKQRKKTNENTKKRNGAILYGELDEFNELQRSASEIYTEIHIASLRLEAILEQLNIKLFIKQTNKGKRKRVVTSRSSSFEVIVENPVPKYELLDVSELMADLRLNTNPKS